jgi:hypothetical protein
MLKNRRIFFGFALVLFLLVNTAPAVLAKPGEHEAIVRHLKTKYAAKKVSIPFMWLARAAVKVVRPAGVKSFNITIFEDLKFSKETLDKEMRVAMRSSFGPEWSSVFNIRSQDGEQVYMYMKEDGKNIKIALVTIDREEAAVIRATFSPEKLADFINDPKIFGISLSDNDPTRSMQKNDPQKGK